MVFVFGKYNRIGSSAKLLAYEHFSKFYLFIFEWNSKRPRKMISYIKRKLEKRRLKRTFKEYGYEIKKFQLKDLGEVEYAGWNHPFEKPKDITDSNLEFYRRITRPGSMVIDIGAHTGDTTVPMALAVGKEGLVLGMEPNPYVYKILKKNASLNPGLTNIVPICAAATAEAGTFTFHYSDASFCNGGFLSEIENQQHHHNYTLDVKGIELEKLLLEKYADRLPSLSLIKVDAEGYDKEILKTIPKILQDYRPNLMVECYKRLSGEERDELFDVIDGFGYDLFYLENFEADGERRQIQKENMMDQRHFEMLALPKKDA
jgi:FkbM family methyltransferase